MEWLLAKPRSFSSSLNLPTFLDLNDKIISKSSDFICIEIFNFLRLKKLSNLQWVPSTVKDVHSWLIGTSILGHIFVWKVTDEKIDLVSILFFEDLCEAILSACSYKPDHLCCVYTSGEVVSWNLFTGEINGINLKLKIFFIFEYFVNILKVD